MVADTVDAIAQFRSAMAEELRALETDELLSRYRFARTIGATFGGKRDIYQILGYEECLTVDHYRERYERGGIAGTVVDIMPDATWRGGFELVEDEAALQEREYTAFETAWRALSDRLAIPSRFHQADVLSRLSTYSVLLIGSKDGDLKAELPRGNGTGEGIIHLQAYVGAGGWRMAGTRVSRRARTAVSDQGGDATIKDWTTDIRDARFGLPRTYGLKRADFSTPDLSQDVHWSRIVHVAENTLDDDVFGRPALARPWNLFDDLEKVSGGGSEAFWLRANRGMQLDISKDIQSLSEPEKNDLKDQVERYVHEMTRVMRTRGVTVKELGSDVANFANPGDFLVTLIAGTTRVPKRILTGSEMGELASSQDRENFRDVISGRRTNHATPRLIRQLADRLIAYNYLPEPKQYVTRWPIEEILTEDERAKGALAWAQINAAYGSVVFTDEEIRDKWYGKKPLTPEEKEAAGPPAPEVVEPAVPA